MPLQKETVITDSVEGCASCPSHSNEKHRSHACFLHDAWCKLKLHLQPVVVEKQPPRLRIPCTVLKVPKVGSLQRLRRERAQLLDVPPSLRRRIARHSARQHAVWSALPTTCSSRHQEKRCASCLERASYKTKASLSETSRRPWQWRGLNPMMSSAEGWRDWRGADRNICQQDVCRKPTAIPTHSEAENGGSW